MVVGFLLGKIIFKKWDGMEDIGGCILGIIMFVFSVLWLYGMFILFVNKGIPKVGFYWLWTVRHNPKTWLQTCLIGNFFVGMIIFIGFVIWTQNTLSTFDSFFKYYILLLLLITHILSYNGIKSLFERIMENYDETIKDLSK